MILALKLFSTLTRTAAPERDIVKAFHVYILANTSRMLYTGVTSQLERRVYQHKHKLIPGFCSKYNLTKLVYIEEAPDMRAAIEREKQIKGWVRRKKVGLIESINPGWHDLAGEWFRKAAMEPRSYLL